MYRACVRRLSGVIKVVQYNIALSKSFSYNNTNNNNETKLLKEPRELLWCAACPVSADPGPAVIVRLCPGSDCCDAQRSDGYKRTVRAHFHMGN